MATENESPAREPAPRGRGRGGRGSRGGRGRGGGRGASSNAAASRAALHKTGRGGTRRGRAKNFADSRVQAAYERQRDLKAAYQNVAHLIKPALQDMAERSIDEMVQKPESFKYAKEYRPVIQQLKRNLDRSLTIFEKRLQGDMELAESTFKAEQYVLEQEFKNAVNDIAEQFYDSQDNRLRILTSLHSKDLPVDIRDDQYEYKVITDDHFDNEFGIYESYKNGYLVPYPSRVEGTEMWQKVRDAENVVNVTSASNSSSTRGGGGRGRGRGSNKRRAQEQPDGQPTPKKATRSALYGQLAPSATITPAPAKGLLASAAEAEAEPEAPGGDEDSAPASPEPNQTNGTVAVIKSKDKQLAREKSPALPKTIGMPDEFGVRMYNQKQSMKEKGINSRLFVPRPVEFEDWEIGFRDSTNDSTKGHTVAKRGKYLNNPNSNGMHMDFWCNGFDYSNLAASDFDRALVAKHGVHPSLGLFLATSVNEGEPNSPYVIPGKPIVYIAQPSGRIAHSSRSFQRTMNYLRVVDAPVRLKMSASVRRFCKMADISLQDIAIIEYLPTEEELRGRSLGTAMRELESRPEVEEVFSEDEEEVAEEQPTDEQAEGGMTGLAVLTYATAYVAAEEVTRIASEAPKPARYDAIRDVFTDSKPSKKPAPEAKSLNLNFLAELCNVETRLAEPEGRATVAPTAAPAPEPDLRITFKPEEPSIAPLSHAPMGAATSHVEPLNGYGRNQHRELPPLQPAGPAHAAAPPPPPVTMPDPIMYQPPQEQAVAHPQHVRATEYKQLPPPPPPPPPAPPGPPAQEHPAYYPPYGSYPAPEPRDVHMGSRGPIETMFGSRHMSGYSNEPLGSVQAQSSVPAPAPAPAPVTGGFRNMYWQPPQVAQAPPPAPPPHSYAPLPPAQHSRMPFSHNASAEPLPPLRPPRSRTHSIQDDGMHDPSMRPAHSMGSYYTPGQTRPYHRGYPVPEPLAPLQPLNTDRILPNPQSGQGYLGSPPPGYGPPGLSPTFGNPQSMSGQLGQSPPGTPQGMPSSIHRHRSTPSGSSDAGNKYRKLQPAPVPAHRAWSNKPELKTIPYDHKETGSSAALPSSGPTQIRGWNVNQHRKRSKADKHDRMEDDSR